MAATGLNRVFGTVVTWSDLPAGKGKYEDADAGVTAAGAAGMNVYKVRTARLHA
nr:hypothetical protein [Actinoplanes sp. ATCC 53533]